MSVVRTFFSNFLVLVTLSFATIHAEQFEFTLHDYHIKKDLAQLGLNLDQEWSSVFDLDGNLLKKKHSELLEKINTIFNHVTIEPPTFQIPSTAQNFSTIFNNLNYNDISYIYEDNKSNETNFDILLKKKHIQKVINFKIQDSVDSKALFQEIIAAISTYISQEAIADRLNADKEKTIESLHIYIKITFDTDDNIFTFQTVPNAAQGCFVRTYSDEDIANWLEESGTEIIPRINASALHTHKTRSCCSRITRFISISALVFGLSYLAHSYPGLGDTSFLSELVKTQNFNDYAQKLGTFDYMEKINTFFENLNITQ